MKREMYDRLAAWKERQSEKRKAFLLIGARQTGKTYIVRKFAKNNYRHLVEFNFIENKENGQFLADAEGADDLISRLSLVVGHPIETDTLIFFDEAQHIGAEVVTLSKFLLDDGRFDLVVSGSLLGTVLGGVTSFPVGYAELHHMHPMNFKEFCWASGVPNAVLETISHHYKSKTPLEESLHNQMMRLFRRYIAVGGMPEAVREFLEGHQDLGAARRTNEAIVEQYRFDITKYSEDRKTQILTIFDNIPSQLAKVNKRFELMSVKEGAVYNRLKDSFAWLVQAGVALPAVLVMEPKYPLLRTEEIRKFKLYSSDCGMLLSRYPSSAAMNVIQGTGDANFGAVYENVIAQELSCAGFPLRYYHNNRKGELDFLLETKDATIVPIEVKSGKNYKLHTALNNLLGTQGYGIEYAYVMSEGNVSVGQKHEKPVYYLPLYMSMCLEEERKDDFENLVLEEISFAPWDYSKDANPTCMLN